ncbi:MAG TPA: dTMP kinase [Paenalcaligenes sp.]|nr:dTMP kinase [Paenalcaligenes sp.]
MTQQGLFLTLEGVDGAGKSTHIPFMKQVLQAHNISVVVTREPGGTPLGESLRELLLQQPMRLKTECLLMFAARNEHIQTRVLPALKKGQWVLCDRFTDASYAYQGGGRALGTEQIRVLEQWVHAGLQPDRTWLFDVPLDLARQRMLNTRVLDRFEKEDVEFFIRTQQAYYDRVHQDPQRFYMVDASRDIQTIQNQLNKELLALIDSWRGVAS